MVYHSLSKRESHSQVSSSFYGRSIYPVKHVRHVLLSISGHPIYYFQYNINICVNGHIQTHPSQIKQEYIALQNHIGHKNLTKDGMQIVVILENEQTMNPYMKYPLLLLKLNRKSVLGDAQLARSLKVATNNGTQVKGHL